MFCPLDEKLLSTYLSQSLGGFGAVLMALESNSSHEWVGYNGNNGATHSCTIDLYIILTMEEEIGILRHNSNNVVMCCMGIEDLLCSWKSCYNFCLMMEMAGSTGKDVERTLTSYDEICSTCCNWMNLMCSTKC